MHRLSKILASSILKKEQHLWLLKGPPRMNSLGLSLVSDFDADLHEEACSKRKLSYGEHSAVLDDVSKEVAFGARATQIWSGSSVNFWSVAICRTLAGSLERLEDHKYVAHILRELPLRCSEDLALHGRNWTFIFNKAHAAKAELHSLHHALWACFGVSGDFNVYLTPPGSQGLAPHADRHDVFVAQQEGEKTWTLLEPDQVRVLENVTLLPGDVLYLPQGVPHYARSAGSASSLHVTMSVYRGHFTFAGLLAAWLEVRPSPKVTCMILPRPQSNKESLYIQTLFEKTSCAIT